VYDYGGDSLLLRAMSVGDAALVESRRVRIRVVGPGGVQKVVDRPVGPGYDSGKGQRRFHLVAVARFSTLFDEAHTGNAAAGEYQVTAYFPADLGGDTFTGVVSILP
jgi:hypothetical protein